MTIPTDEQIQAMNARHEAQAIAMCEELGYGFVIDVAARGWARIHDAENVAVWLASLAKGLRAWAKGRSTPKRTLRRQRSKSEGNR